MPEATAQRQPESRNAAGLIQGVPPPAGDFVSCVHERLAQQINGPAASTELSGDPQDEWNLVTRGTVGEETVLHAYAEVSGIPLAEEEDLQGIEAFPELSYDYLVHWGALPLWWDRDTVVMAVYTPYSLGALAFQWRSVFQQSMRVVLARRSVVERLQSALYEQGGAVETDQGFSLTGEASEETLRDLAREAPVVRLVNDLFNRAVDMEASDIHVEPGEEELAIRYRIDGVLTTIQTHPMSMYPALASRIKLLAEMNIAEHRLPQDGRIDWRVGRSELDVRVSTVPSMWGESIVLRLLQKDLSEFSLDSLGMESDVRKTFEGMVKMPHGMVLVVGPTGSGKTTTLYSAMRLLNTQTRKIITIEDPVEYQLAGLTQIQVRPQIDLTFANGLRSIVRQDPDVILVGEIRDRETAEIAIHAALTGHLVFSTLHTNDAAGAISRLLEMGVESFLISSATLGVLSQRLIRTVCSSCEGAGLAARESSASGEPKKCRRCGGTGFRGRVGIFELLRVTPRVRDAINERTDSTEIAKLAEEAGMRPLIESGRRKAEAGLTTDAEIARVCQLDTGGAGAE